jgi:hypothetical protein
MNIVLRRFSMNKNERYGIDVYLDEQRIACVIPPSPIIDKPYWEAIGYKRFPASGTAAGFGQFLTRKAALRAAVAWARQIAYAELSS